ncbi:MAG: iron-binding protein [Sulfurospirillum sp.]|nr:MAG: iron-binding protein [Sulfurospirillum sp.]
MKSDLFVKKHELWLRVLFGAFSIKDEKLYDLLYDFAMIEYRHLLWLGNELKEQNIEFDFNREQINIEYKDNFELFNSLVKEFESIKSHYGDSVMFERFLNDESYFIHKLELLLSVEKNNKKITAFDKSRKLEDVELNDKQLNALIMFLFEESYKEYELILVYTYSNFFTDSKMLSSIFFDLIYESHFHLKSFARMMSNMGLLALPRVVAKRVYQFDDLVQFLNDGIKEEEGAKELCIKLANEIDNEILSPFFTFINNQESYHIALMQKALKHIEENL